MGVVFNLPRNEAEHTEAGDQKFSVTVAQAMFSRAQRNLTT